MYRPSTHDHFTGIILVAFPESTRCCPQQLRPLHRRQRVLEAELSGFQGQ
jgi:hypothetical protein